MNQNALAFSSSGLYMVRMSNPPENTRGTPEVRMIPLHAGLFCAELSVVMKDSINSKVIKFTGGDNMVIVPMPEGSSTTSDTRDRVRDVIIEDREMGKEVAETSPVIFEAEFMLPSRAC